MLHNMVSPMSDALKAMSTAKYEIPIEQIPEDLTFI